MIGVGLLLCGILAFVFVQRRGFFTWILSILRRVGLRIGYLDEVVKVEELDHRIDTLAEAVASLAPLAVTGMKASINELAVDRSSLASVDARAKAAFASNDHREAMRALKEKRAPHFTGT